MGKFDFGKFEILNLELVNGVLEMPLERDEYKNITVLDKNFLSVLSSCFKDNKSCENTGKTNKEIKTEILDIRQAGKIFLAEISFDSRLLVTFTVTENKGVVRVRRPSDFKFKDSRFERYLKNLIRQSYKDIKNESGKPK